MGWWNKHGQYCRSKREGGRVRSIRMGQGPAAHLAAVEDELRRSRNEAQEKLLRSELARQDDRAALLQQLDQVADQLMRVELVANGCYQHARMWRKRCVFKNRPQ